MHVRTTGPETWAETDGRVTHFVAGVGTGGTITGTGAYLHEVSGGAVTVVGADPEASVYSGGDGSPYYVESIGHFINPDTDEDLLPQAFDAGVVDRFERISDRESLLTARRLAREEGLLAGPSSGTAVAAALRVARDLGADDLVVVLLPDSGRSYLSKVFSDDWLRHWGFLEEPSSAALVGDVLDPAERRPLVTVPPLATVADAIAAAPGRVVPVVQARDVRPLGIAASEALGAVDTSVLAADVAAGRTAAGDSILAHLAAPLPTVGIGETLSAARTALGETHPAVVVLVDGRAVAVPSRADLHGFPEVLAVESQVR